MYLGWILWQLLSFYINYFLKLREQCSWEYNNMLRWIMIWDYHLTQDCTHIQLSHILGAIFDTNLQPAANCQPEACAPDQWRDGWRNYQRTISSEALFGEDCEASFCMALTLLAVQVSNKNQQIWVFQIMCMYICFEQNMQCSFVTGLQWQQMVSAFTC